LATQRLTKGHQKNNKISDTIWWLLVVTDYWRFRSAGGSEAIGVTKETSYAQW
jgi:hypothetical protein